MKLGYQLVAFSFILITLFTVAFIFDEGDAKTSLERYQRDGYIYLDSGSTAFLQELISNYATPIFGQRAININGPLRKGSINVFTLCADPDKRFGHQLYNASYHPGLDSVFIDCLLVAHSSMAPNGHASRYLDFLVLHELGHKKLHQHVGGTLFDRPVDYRDHPQTMEQYNIELNADRFALKQLLLHKNTSNETFEYLLNLAEISITSIPENSALTLLHPSQTHPNFIVRLESFYRAIIEENIFSETDQEHWKRIADSYLSWIKLSEIFNLVNVDFPNGYVPEHSCMLGNKIVVKTYPESFFLIDKSDINFQSELTFLTPTKLTDTLNKERFIDCTYDNNLLFSRNREYFLQSLEDNVIKPVSSIGHAQDAYHVKGSIYASVGWNSDDHSFTISKVNLSSDSVISSKKVKLDLLGIASVVDVDEEFGSTLWHWNADKPDGPYLKFLDINQNNLWLTIHENKNTKLIGYNFETETMNEVNLAGYASTLMLKSGNIISVIAYHETNSINIRLYNDNLQVRFNTNITSHRMDEDISVISDLKAVLVNNHLLAISTPGLGFYIIDIISKRVVLKNEWNTNLNYLSNINIKDGYLGVGFPYSRTILFASKRD